ncbi:MAG TPA: hypothetical protein VK003_05675 [Oceanobacillus sp.]|nr:hypothetical protein [Oceanobacillus sp.]
MPVSVEWGNEEKTFVIFTFEGNWTWEEYYQGRKRGIELGNEVPHVVNLIVDYSKSSMFPSNMLSHFGSSIDHNPKDFDICVIVTQSAFVNALVNALSKYKKKFRFRVVRTLEAGIQFFKEYDAQTRPSQAMPSGS